VILEDAPRVGLVKHNDMVEALTPGAAVIRFENESR
jgi:hypothetical protein